MIVEEALSKPARRIAIITYTLNNVDELKRRFYQLNGSIPPHVEIYSWFAFLLREGARPYQNYVYSARRIETIAFVSGRSAKFTKKKDVQRYFFSEGRAIYTDKISEFVCACNAASGNLVIERLSRIYDDIYIDEVQDLAGFDLDFVVLLLKSPIRILLVGDHRQATYSTNVSAKNSQFRGTHITKLFEKWRRKGLCEVKFLAQSHRCNQLICDFADRLYPDMPPTTSLNKVITGHDGLFLVTEADVAEYVSLHSPAVLRFDKKTECAGHNAINFGDSKGLTFDRVLIFPHGPIAKYLATGQLSHVEKSCAKFYVAVTRARYSVAFVCDGECKIDHITAFKNTVDKQPVQLSLFDKADNDC